MTHFIGIGGVGMAALAVLMKRRGREVTGCDLSRTKRTEWLEAQGIPVAIGHDPRHLEGADEVIVTPAVHRDNPELAAAGRTRCRGEALAEIVNAAADTIAVAGSHGKTTTATFVAKLLIALGERVEWAIGGETGSFPVAGCSAAEPEVLVVEADESDGTLAAYRPKTLVVTNVDYDHPDHFPTREAYEAFFAAAKRRAERVVEGKGSNAETAIAVAVGRGHSRERAAAAMREIAAELPDRRFERLAEGVYTDYGHHPTEVAYSIRHARETMSGGRLRVLFQAHRYTRTRAFLGEFAAAFDGADEVVICPTYAAFEPRLEGGTAADLYAAVRARGRTRAYLARSCEEAWEHARNSRAEGDVTLVQGAGDIIRLRERIVSGRRDVRRVLVGAGTNTWRSDLKTDEEYVRTEGPAAIAGSAAKLPDGRALTEIAPWMAGIPGTLGGWVKMNAGAFGHAIGEVIEAVRVDGRWIPAAECGFGYRRSGIRGEIQEVRFRELAGPAEGVATAAEYLARRKRFPSGTKGSVFKNPPGDFSGRLLEAAGAKGMRVGGAYVWEEHANVIVAGPGATASDFLALARLMRDRVRYRFGVELEPEVRGMWDGGREESRSRK